MLTHEQNELLTRVGPATPMGNLLRRYWMPIAGVSEFDDRHTKPVRLFGEDLVLYRDLRGQFGLVDRHCAHRRADLSYGMVEADGLRCHYHGWQFDHTGACVQQPFEDMVRPDLKGRERVSITAYPVEVKAGLVWVYMGPQPAPLVPDWEPFSRPNGFVQVVLSEVPCNWLQAQENSIDPVHFEWMHENWGNRLVHGADAVYGPTHIRLAFDEFDYGLTYRRIRADTDENHPIWTVGRVCLWPNGFFLGEHFEWRVPIDDENTLSVVWKFTHVPKECVPYQQKSIPTWTGPVADENGNWITSHVINQDFTAWLGQGRIADRTRERLGASDQGVVMLRRLLFAELERVARGEDPKGLIRDPAMNKAVKLPVAFTESAQQGYSREDILADPHKRTRFLTFMFQAGQPDWVRREFAHAMGMQPEEFSGFRRPGHSM